MCFVGLIPPVLLLTHFTELVNFFDIHVDAGFPELFCGDVKAGFEAELFTAH